MLLYTSAIFEALSIHSRLPALLNDVVRLCQSSCVQRWLPSLKPKVAAATVAVDEAVVEGLAADREGLAATLAWHVVEAAAAAA